MLQLGKPLNLIQFDFNKSGAHSNTSAISELSTVYTSSVLFLILDTSLL